MNTNNTSQDWHLTSNEVVEESTQCKCHCHAGHDLNCGCGSSILGGLTTVKEDCEHCEVVEDPMMKIIDDYIEDFKKKKAESIPQPEDWEKRFNKRFTPIVDEGEEILALSIDSKDVKAFIRTLLKEQEEKHKEKMESIQTSFGTEEFRPWCVKCAKAIKKYLNN